ncbi:hypothetical protein BDZ89DRAFT_1150196 [Hymenopellis radicata]|nr:hypothetical protein BDZ89DRAFT_1150196 [Hymenopellis radicata]
MYEPTDSLPENLDIASRDARKRLKNFIAAQRELRNALLKRYMTSMFQDDSKDEDEAPTACSPTRENEEHEEHESEEAIWPEEHVLQWLKHAGMRVEVDIFAEMGCTDMFAVWAVATDMPPLIDWEEPDPYVHWMNFVA